MAARATYVVLARIPPGGVQAFQSYEANVLPLLAEHGGLLERRLRGADGLVEVHLVSFPSTTSFAAYRDDPRRGAHQHLLAQSGASIELLSVDDVG